eukprot:14881121-Heterocapsa_arctica.AAC.1
MGGLEGLDLLRVLVRRVAQHLLHVSDPLVHAGALLVRVRNALGVHVVGDLHDLELLGVGLDLGLRIHDGFLEILDDVAAL